METTTDCGPGFWLLWRIVHASGWGLLVISVAKATGSYWMLESIGAWLDNWQTLIAALIALAAAISAVRAVRDQNTCQDEAAKKHRDQVEEHRLDDLRRKHRVARIRLPSALSVLTDYANECIKLIKSIPINGNDRLLLKPGDRPISDPPEIPSEATSVMTSFIEATDDATSEVVTTFLERLQIQHSRLSHRIANIRTDTSHIVVPDNVVTDALTTTEILYRINSMWPYARRQSQTIRPGVDQMEFKFLLERDFSEHDYPTMTDARIAFAVEEANRFPLNKKPDGEEGP